MSKEEKKGCNCGKRTFDELLPYSDDNIDNVDKKSFLTTLSDFILTIIFRIISVCIIMIMGCIVIPLSMLMVLFKGTNDLNFDITKFLLKVFGRYRKKEDTENAE